MSKYLNSSGLAYFWGKFKDRLLPSGGSSGQLLAKTAATDYSVGWTDPYSLPTASTSVLGGVKVDGSTIVINNGVISSTMVILSYGNSTWANFEAAYSTNSVVYCKASSNSNPATGTQTRMAFMAYVNAGFTEVEFQYYRSIATHSATQQGDQVFVYKLNKSTGWSVTTREAATKIEAGTGMTQSYANGTLTLDVTPELPSVSASDNDKVLGVVSGAWAVMTAPGGSGTFTYQTTTASIPTTGWSNDSITVNVSGVTAANDVVLAPAPSSASAYVAAGIFCTAQGAGTLTFTRKRENDSAIIVNVMILDDDASSGDAPSASGVSF